MSGLYAGLDIGSRAIKFVLLGKDGIFATQVIDTGYDPLDRCRYMLGEYPFDGLVATGYGRHLIGQNLDDVTLITEIKAASIGARYRDSECRTVIDIGGQDTKAIALDDAGRVLKFAMNDRCAAGTGRFLEVMATALGLQRHEFIALANDAEHPEKLSSMCTVFAESEVISLISRGANRGEIALGIHQSIASRTAGLAKTVPVKPGVLFIGGGALNGCLPPLLSKALGQEVVVPESPQLTAALGCALHAKKLAEKVIDPA